MNSEDPWKDVVDRNRQFLDDNLAVDRSLVYHLMEPGLLTANDMDEINAVNLDPKKLDLLLRKLRTKGRKKETFETFLEVLRKADRHWIVDDLLARADKPDSNKSLLPPSSTWDAKGLRSRRSESVTQPKLLSTPEPSEPKSTGRSAISCSTVVAALLAVVIVVIFSIAIGTIRKGEARVVLDMPLNEFILVVSANGHRKWKEIGLKLGIELNVLEGLEHDDLRRSGTHRLQALLQTYYQMKGDTKEMREDVLRACIHFGIEGSLRDSIQKEGYSWPF